MTLKEILHQIEDVPDIVGWFASIRETENITSNHHGKNVNEFVELMESLSEKADPNGNIPVIHFVFFHDGNANSFIENRLWNALDYETWESHQHANIPYIGLDGKFYNLSY